MDRNSPLWGFCGFTNGSNWRYSYIMDENTLILLPCAELTVVVLQTAPLLFFTVIHISAMQVDENRRIRRGFYYLRIIICFLTAVISAGAIFFSVFSKFGLKLANYVEYGLLAFFWIYFAVYWMAVLRNSCKRRTSISIANFFASKVFVLLTTWRCMAYGLLDPRASFPAAVSVLQILFSLTNIIEFCLNRKYNAYRNLNEDVLSTDEDEDESCGFFSRIFFCWTNQLIAKGSKGELQQPEDLLELPASMKIAPLESEFVLNSPTYYTDGQHFSLSRSLINTFGVKYLFIGVLKLLSDLLTLAGPLILHYIIVAFDENNLKMQIITFSLLLSSVFISSLMNTNYNFYVNKISLKVRTVTISSLFEKLVMVPAHSLSTFSSGMLLNFISSDVDRVVNFCPSFHSVWSLPLQFALALILLYREVGKAFLSGIVVAILLIPINQFIAKKIGSASKTLMEHKDARVKLTTEVMNNARSVRMSSWGKFFFDKIAGIREKELKYLGYRKYLDALCVYLWASTHLMITTAILATYTLVMQNELTAEKIFPTIAIVNILIGPLNAYPWVLNGFIEALVSLWRIQSFFNLGNIDYSSIYSLNQDPKSLIQIRNSSFRWKKIISSSNSYRFSLRAGPGSIIGITGNVGCGKTTLLMGLLGETLQDGASNPIKISPRIADRGIGYVGADKWLSRGTIRQNIVCNKDFNQKKYLDVIAAACLAFDIQNFPGNDQYIISDNGSTLSGGQRTRLALARALYQDCDLYLLDNPFASLDRKVGDGIWEAVKKLKKRGKCVIITSQDHRYLSQMDKVLVIGSDGRIAEGSPVSVLDKMQSTSEATESEEHFPEESEIVLSTESEEERKEGHVRLKVYRKYAQATGWFMTFLIVFSLTGMQASRNFADFWLSRWTTKEQQNGTEYSSFDTDKLLDAILSPDRIDSIESIEGDFWSSNSMFYFKIYCYIALGNTVVTLFRAFFFAYGGILAARHMHKDLLSKLLTASLHWWDRMPIGRIINRVCSDVYTVDDNLPFILNICLAALFGLIGSLVVSLVALPVLLPVMIVLAVIYYIVQEYYRKTSVELKRLSSVTKSPLFSHWSDTMNGIVTIRALRLVDSCTDKLRRCLSTYIRTEYSNLAASSWLSIRLTALAFVIATCIAIIAVVQHQVYGVNSALIALAITYALSLTNQLNNLLTSFIETEKELVAVERCGEYIDEIPTEEWIGKVFMNALTLRGGITFQKVYLRYGADLPNALDGISFVIKPGERVAIIGRTGSGKTSIFQALLSTAPIIQGEVYLDHFNIRELDVNHMRSLIGVVHQDPFIMSGSLYENLTVNHKGVDRDVVSSLIRMPIFAESLMRSVGDLDTVLEEAGKNLSHGEKQLIALGRILIQRPKIILIDEGTSQLGSEWHSRVIELIASHLRDSTVLSIVHDLSVLHEYHTVIEMSAGCVKRIGPPPPSSQKQHFALSDDQNL